MFHPFTHFFKITLQVSAYPKFSDAIITVFQAIKYTASLPSHWVNEVDSRSMQIPVVKTLLWLVSFYTRASHLSPFKAQIGSQKSDYATCLRSNQPLQRYIDQYCHDAQTANIICSILLKNKSLTLNLQPKISHTKHHKCKERLIL